MKNCSTIVLLLLLVLKLHGQIGIDSFDISQFKYADATFRSLDLSLNQSSFTVSSHGNPSEVTGIRFLFNGNLNGYVFKNTRKLQRVTNYGLYYNTYKSGFPPSWNNEVNVNWGLESRYYKESNFWEIKPSIETFTNISERAEVDLRIALKRGKGRLEPVDDVYMLRWIVKDLEEEGINKDNWTQEELFELANRINVIRNYRLFDGRRQLKTQLKDASALISEQIGNQDRLLDMYATVFDNYTGAIRGNRMEGKRVAVALQPSVIRSFEGKQNDPQQYGLELAGELVESKNTSLNFQKLHEVRLGIEYLSSKPNYYHSSGEKVSSFADANLRYDYFPNSRTSISGLAGIRLRYEHIIDFDYDLNHVSKFNYEPSLGLYANYFINYRTRLRFEATLNTQGRGRDHILEPRLLVFNNHISLTHSLF